MNKINLLGIHYHNFFCLDENGINAQSHIGVFIDSLAAEVDELIIFGHKKNTDNNFKYNLKSQNIKFIDIGQKKSALYRSIFGKYILTKHRHIIKKCDAFLVRGPTPLLPAFIHYRKNLGITSLLVGSYKSKSIPKGFSILKNISVWVVNNVMDLIIKSSLKNSNIVSNSSEIIKEYKHINKDIKKISTSIIHDKDIVLRSNSCNSNDISILYVGRIQAEKGIFELFEAFSSLSDLNEYSFKLNLIGEEINSKKISTYIKNEALKREIADQIIIHGYMDQNRLFEYYQKSDIFIIPSYYEGFPRVVWEAFAFGCPVIASKVGDIPYTLDNTNSILIDPKSSNDIYEAVLKILKDKKLRDRNIKNAYNLVKANTIEKNTRKLLSYVATPIGKENLGRRQ